MALTKLTADQAAAFAGTATRKDMVAVAQDIRRTDANAHTSRAHTLSRGDVRGGGKKPWKQKGTGRARTSSIRSPLWRGGGIIFGPKNVRNHKLAMPQSMRARSLAVALQLKAADEALWTTDALPTDAKTKSLVALIPTDLTGKRVLVVLDKPTAEVAKAGRNIQGLTVRVANQVTTRDVLVAQAVIGTAEAFKALAARTTGATA